MDDCHSTTGNLFLMAGGAISWLSKKQAVVALSISEAEYIALSLATQEAVCLKKLLTDLMAPPDGPTILMEEQLPLQEILLVMLGQRHSVSLHP